MSFNLDAIPIKNEALGAMRLKIKRRLERARDNPISRKRYEELASRFAALNNKFVKTGIRDPEYIKKQNLVRNEALESVAVADNLIEFKELLKQWRNSFPKAALTPAYMQNNLEHENAHANVSAQLGFGWIGYGLLFIKEKDGGMSIMPGVYDQPNPNWGPKETLTKTIDVANAPFAYGNELSQSDTEHLADLKRLLEEIEKKENE